MRFSKVCRVVVFVVSGTADAATSAARGRVVRRVDLIVADWGCGGTGETVWNFDYRRIVKDSAH